MNGLRAKKELNKANPVAPGLMGKAWSHLGMAFDAVVATPLTYCTEVLDHAVINPLKYCISYLSLGLHSIGNTMFPGLGSNSVIAGQVNFAASILAMSEVAEAFRGIQLEQEHMDGVDAWINEYKLQHPLITEKQLDFIKLNITKQDASVIYYQYGIKVYGFDLDYYVDYMNQAMAEQQKTEAEMHKIALAHL